MSVPSSEGGVAAGKTGTSTQDVVAELEMTSVSVNRPSKRTRRNRTEGGSRRAKPRFEGTYCGTVGIVGTLVLLMILSISGLLLFLWYRLTNQFRLNIGQLLDQRLETFYFITFAVFYALMWGRLLCTWRTIAASHLKSLRPSQHQPHGVENMRVYKLWKCVCKYNGPAYIAKTFVFEAVENTNQCLNLINIYSCNLPVSVTLACTFVLFADSAYRCKVNYGGVQGVWSMKSLDRELAEDFVLDFLFALMPVVVTWFVFSLPLTPREYFSLLWVPLINMMMKLRTMFRRLVHNNAAAVWSRQSPQKKEMVSVHYHKITQAQRTFIGRRGFVCATLWSFLFSIGYATIFIVQLVSFLNMRCDEVLWHNGCVVKIPFCGVQHVVRPTCNCAKLCIGPHNMTELPSDLIGPGNVTDLKSLDIKRGPLRMLPHDIVTMRALANVNVDHNGLRDVPAFSNANNPSLQWLSMPYNNLSRVPKAVWELENLAELFLDGNDIVEIPADLDETTVQEKQLVLLSLTGNKLTTLPEWVFDLPALTDLMVDKNRLDQIPPGIVRLKGQLVLLRADENHLTHFPSGFFDIGVQYMDLSYNDLNASVFVDPDGPLPEHLFVAGNPMCENVAALGASWQRHLRVVEAYEYPEGCHKQCAKGCWDWETVGDYCNAECNVTDCHFDGGACLGSESCIRLQ